MFKTVCCSCQQSAHPKGGQGCRTHPQSLWGCQCCSPRPPPRSCGHSSACCRARGREPALHTLVCNTFGNRLCGAQQRTILHDPLCHVPEQSSTRHHSTQVCTVMSPAISLCNWLVRCICTDVTIWDCCPSSKGCCDFKTVVLQVVVHVLSWSV